MNADALERVKNSVIVPVVTIDDPMHADPIAQALVDGGVTAIEITLRTPLALSIIERLSSRTDIVVGAGTVLSPSLLSAAVARGAQFVVSPGFDPHLVEAAQQMGAPIVPGVGTAGEIQQALALGVDHVKFFPANLLGGFAALDAFHAPLPQVRFMPSGGVSKTTLPSYAAHPAVFAVGVSWLVPRGMNTDGLYASVLQASREAKTSLPA